MDTTIRNIDPRAYRALKARAAVDSQTVGEAINTAIRTYLATPEVVPKHGSLRDFRPEPYPDGNERLSEQVDAIVYGA